MNAITITRANVLNLSNADLKNFLKSVGIEANVNRNTRDEAEAKAIAHFEKVTASEGATDGSKEPGAWVFPTAASMAAKNAVVVVAESANPAGWESVDGGASENGGEVEESEEDAAARIEAEAAAENEEVKERKARAASRASNSEGVALSWRNPEVRTARLTRDGITVADSNGVTQTFKSVAEGFRSLRLPFEKHIKFRLALKASRSEKIEKDGVIYTFTM